MMMVINYYVKTYCILVTTYERSTNYHVFRRYREFDSLAKNVKYENPKYINIII